MGLRVCAGLYLMMKKKASIPAELIKAVVQGQLPADKIGPALEEMTAQQILKQVRAGSIQPNEAKAYFEDVRAGQMDQQRQH